MQARGPLMIEHRLIEKMLKVIQRTLEYVEQTQTIDPYFVDTLLTLFGCTPIVPITGRKKVFYSESLRSNPYPTKAGRLWIN